MYLLILVTSALFVATNGQALNMVHFIYHDKESLMTCIENSKYLKEIKKHRGSDFVHIFAESAAEELAGRNDVSLYFGLDKVLESLNIVPHDFPSTSRSKFYDEVLVEALREAVNHCSDDYNFKRCSESNHTANCRLLPSWLPEVFKQHVTRFVNLAASSFSEAVHSMASTPDRFMTLLRFVDDFVAATEELHETFNSSSNIARVEVRDTWRVRIAKSMVPVFLYHYNGTIGEVYTCGCNKDSSRYPNVTSRNKLVSAEEASRILRLFLSHSSNGFGDKIYNRYMTEDMRFYERALEILLIQKYRIVIFIYGLRIRGILNDQTVIDQAFIDGLPRCLLDILRSDEAYVELFTRLRKFIISQGVDNPLEEDVILFLYYQFNARSLGSSSYSYNNVRHVSSNTTMTTTKSMSTSEKPFYKRLEDNTYKYLKGTGFGNEKYELLPDDDVSDKFKSQNDKAPQCSEHSRSNFKDELGFFREALSIYLSSSVCSQ